MQHRLRISLELMLDAIERINMHLDGQGAQVLFSDATKLDACLMQLVHIGELAGRIHKRYGANILTDIELTRVVGLRNLIAHDYLGINVKVVARIIETNLPELQKAINKILNQ